MRTAMLAPVLFLFAATVLIAVSSQDNVRSEAHNPVISHIPRGRVASGAIASIGYSKRRHILEIEFVNGAIYCYLEASPSVFRELMASDSKARYYDADFKGNYPSARLRSRVKDQAN